MKSFHCVHSLFSPRSSFDLHFDATSGDLRVFLILVTGQLEIVTLPAATAPNNWESAASVDIAIRNLGASHASDVRSVCFSSDSTALLSASAKSARLWNRSSQSCVRTLSCGYVLCSCFVPGDKHVILGTKEGKLELFELASGSLLQSEEAHGGAVWSLCLNPDKRGLVSGGADKAVKFWDFELLAQPGKTSRQLCLAESRCLLLDEDVLNVRLSPNGRLLSASLLDNTTKIFYTDTLKFFLSLYGHKLPVLCTDISSDSTLIVTGSADRNIKIWGLDFGDCHRSVFAHDDSVLDIQFVPQTHLFFSSGKDGTVKQWDADKFQLIQTLKGHLASVWAIAVSPCGGHVVSASHDGSLRLWHRTQEPLILEEEREAEREAEYDQSMVQGQAPVIPGETQTETGLAGRKTVETVHAAERLMEALEILREEQMEQEQREEERRLTAREPPAIPINPILQAHGNISAEKYVLEVLKKVKSSELDEALLVLPFSDVSTLLFSLGSLLDTRKDTELLIRASLFLLRIHFGQISSAQHLSSAVQKLKENTSNRVEEKRDVLGFNLAALRLLRHQLDERDEVRIFSAASDAVKEKLRKRKRKERALLTIT
uniref:Small-subunit processome Utp12 domain-containing protein n=1 Tax=Eptatretus burgeri TaxID=7764 RepID=A0A8C4QVD1_EPTBU